MSQGKGTNTLGVEAARQGVGNLSRERSRERSPAAQTHSSRISEKVAKPVMRTKPAWIRDEDEEELQSPAAVLSPLSADSRFYKRNSLVRPSKHWVVPNAARPSPHIGSQWTSFAQHSAYRRLHPEESHVVTEQWWEEHGPKYTTDWKPSDQDLEKTTERDRRQWWKRIQPTLLKNPFVPLGLRVLVWTFSLISMSLAASIFSFYQSTPALEPDTSPEMAIIVDVVALFYLVWIMWDEYTGKPLGLRQARAKMRLIFLDLFFIVFQSANLSLAFEAVRDAANDPDQRPKLKAQQSLAAMILIALVAWLMTFSISVLRFRDDVFFPLFSIAFINMEITPRDQVEVSSHQIDAFKLLPNTSVQKHPLLVYKGVFPPSASASEIEKHLVGVGIVEPAWRFPMFEFTHFHATTHEVLCVYSGQARLCFGGEENPSRIELTAEKGDVLIVPAGVAHRMLEDRGGFMMVGSYPIGKSWDMCYGRAGEEVCIEAEWFERDPVYGTPLTT